MAEKTISATASRAWWRTRRGTGGAPATPVTPGAVGVRLIGSTPLDGTDDW
jgi:hypothetical protein